MKKTTKKQDIENAVIIDIADIHSKIAEQAYYKAEQKGFLPGHEEQDWLEAEQEILNNLV